MASKAEYLKRYLSGSDPARTEKKRKKKAKLEKIIKRPNLAIMDDDVDWRTFVPKKKVGSEDEMDPEDAPVVTEVHDETAILWQPVKSMGLEEGEGSPPRSVSPDLSPPRRGRHDSPDLSPPRARQHDSPDLSPPRARRHDSPDLSPPRARRPVRHDSPDLSPPRARRPARQDSPDLSPPRPSSRKHGSSPPQRTVKRPVSPDPSPPRRGRPDLSPPRKTSRWDSKPTKSSKRMKRQDSPDSTVPPQPHRPVYSPKIDSRQRARHDSPDTSPPRAGRRHDTPDASPVTRRHDSPDFSPPRRRHDSPESSIVQSAKRQESPDPLQSSKAVRDVRSRGDSAKRMTSGVMSGLQNAEELKRENALARKRQEDFYKSLDPEMSGRHAETVHRDKSGRKVDPKLEKIQKREEQRLKTEEDEKFMVWGRGVAQVQHAHEKVANELYEMSKPLARYADDEDLERMLKARERDGDPMLAYIQKKKPKVVDEVGRPKKQRPMYKGASPANRFGIRPGYRWDGVDRSNGFEKAWFSRQANEKAVADEAYKWSVEDM